MIFYNLWETVNNSPIAVFNQINKNFHFVFQVIKTRQIIGRQKKMLGVFLAREITQSPFIVKIF